MTFYVQGLNAHEALPLDKVLKKPRIEKAAPAIPVRRIDEKEHRDNMEKRGLQHSASEIYQSVSALPIANDVILAEQIMSSSVVTLTTQSVVADALALFKKNRIRHLPVVSSAGLLIGMVSERDVLHHLSGITENYQQQASQNSGDRVSVLMKSPVLTASTDTDIRYIARLFVERRVGALPIVSHSELKGIIARSDVLTAVMRHFVLELWA